MGELISFLSSGIPGGIFLLFIVLFVINLSLFFLKNSELMSPATWKKNLITLNLAAFLFYAALWFITQPPKPQERVVVLPTQISDTLSLTPEEFLLTETFEKAALNNTNDRYLVHRWEWLFETIKPRQRSQYAEWQRTARALRPRFIVESRIENGQMTCLVLDVKKNKRVQIAGKKEQGVGWFIRRVDGELGLFKDTPSIPQIDRTILAARLALYNKDYARVLALVEGREDIPARTLKAAVLIEKGLQVDVDQERAKYVPIKNPDFEKAKQILVPIVKQRKNTPEIDLLMGRMLIREKEYTAAEMFLKKAYVEDPENSRVHFNLSFLLPDRLKDIGYNSRVQILKRAIYLDPGYRDAVYQLANEIYLSGRGTLGSIQEAINIINRFLEIHPGDPEMLSLLGTLYIKTNYVKKALPIYKALFEEFPDDSDSYYNLGVCYYMLDEYNTALPYFLKAIEMDRHLDSYLYVGMIYRKMGKLDSALKYFRERVARKTGDDDTYAKEAMAGIRSVLIQMEEEKIAAKADSSKQSSTHQRD
ncbi:Tetratricopeptide TPR_1 repeat-containing protein [Caldithrix abyssi DSM 13497]|uniref:TPR repeat-containing protein n=1 Tax=Caldithrix abyssi DSM 13497 TaxID=880073 RepID=H1XP01_CALAY|nr:tetratricopeptide repeat protein [Caldithrix abyssi]APF20483.1 TPR repeat-containing protein [Caldithrix abyssi DSM 13497]EHO40993.1 Tetratricopeptide TPR_1 repeat-containing protein [Caldithrix abyssi DSM 13497]